MKICKKNHCIGRPVEVMCRYVEGHVSIYQYHVPFMCRHVESAHETEATGLNTAVYVMTCSKDVSTYNLENFI